MTSCMLRRTPFVGQRGSLMKVWRLSPPPDPALHHTRIRDRVLNQKFMRLPSPQANHHRPINPHRAEKLWAGLAFRDRLSDPVAEE